MNENNKVEKHIPLQVIAQPIDTKIFHVMKFRDCLFAENDDFLPNRVSLKMGGATSYINYRF